MTPTFMNAFCEAFAHAKNKSRGCTPPLVECIAKVQLSCVQIRECDKWTAIQPCICQPRRSHGWLVRDRLGPEKPVKGVWHDQRTNSSLPYCRYAGIVLLKERNVSNSLIILQDMWVKDFIYIALVCK